MEKKLDAEVIISGAGPVGMVAALALNLRGISVIVLESEPNQDRAEWRGSTLHAPTLEIFDELGIINPIIEDGIRLESMVYRDLQLDELVAIPYSYLEGETPYPFRLQYEQYKVLRHLKEELAIQNIPVLYEHSLKKFEQFTDSVATVVDNGSSEKSLNAKWLLAADGAHSLIRKQLQLPFPGFTYPTQSLVVASEFPFQDFVENLSPVSYWSGPSGRVSIIQTPDIWRVAVTTGLAAEDSFYYDEVNPHPSFVEAMELLLKGQVDPREIQLQQHQFYRSHQRLAETFKVGRVLLAGDAAHLSSTTGGMGLNSGVHDAYQFAKAFEAPDVELGLEQYALGRRNASEKTIQPQTTQNRAGTDLLDLSHRKERLQNLQKLASNVDEAKKYIFDISMINSAGLL